MKNLYHLSQRFSSGTNGERKLGELAVKKIGRFIDKTTIAIVAFGVSLSSAALKGAGN